MKKVKSKKAIQKCANWLAFCLRIGWDKKDLDKLEDLWWQGHNWTTGEPIRYARVSAK